MGLNTPALIFIDVAKLPFNRSQQFIFILNVWMCIFPIASSTSYNENLQLFSAMFKVRHISLLFCIFQLHVRLNFISIIVNPLYFFSCLAHSFAFSIHLCFLLIKLLYILRNLVPCNTHYKYFPCWFSLLTLFFKYWNHDQKVRYVSIYKLPYKLPIFSCRTLFLIMLMGIKSKKDIKLYFKKDKPVFMVLFIK